MAHRVRGLTTINLAFKLPWINNMYDVYFVSLILPGSGCCADSKDSKFIPIVYLDIPV